MTEDFKQWVCQNAGIDRLHYPHLELEILIKAMWSINRGGEWNIDMDYFGLSICKSEAVSQDTTYEAQFHYKDHNSSELEALTKALQYVMDNSKCQHNFESDGGSCTKCGNTAIDEEVDNTKGE